MDQKVKEHEVGYCWCGAFHPSTSPYDLRDIEARAHGGYGVDERTVPARKDVYALLALLRYIRTKAQAYLDANETQAPTAAANLRYALARMKDDDDRIEAVYKALGKIKGINSTCEQHHNYPWQLHCETCRRFVAEELVSLGARIDK